MNLLKPFVTAAVLSGAAFVNADAIDIEAAVASDLRTSEYVLRDESRHPAETLAFFQVSPGDVVVEVWPGGGWYSEILAPLTKAEGKLIAAHFPSDTEIGYYRRARAAYESKMADNPALYGDVELVEMIPDMGIVGVAKESADKVLTFRNVHNWLRGGNEQRVFNSFYDTLKPGGMLGVVEHRAAEGASREEMLKSGYMTQSYVVELAENAGFELVAASEINANLADTKDHPKGVWSLPPSRSSRDDADAARYDEIGESDRMTLLFVKPE